MGQIPSDIQESLSKLFQLYLENEEFLLHLLAMVMIVLSGIVYVILLYTPATYGRYSNSTNRFYNIGVPAKTAWFFQEAPAILLPSLLIYLTSIGVIAPKYEQMQLRVLSMFLIHYAQRTFIYPFLIKGGKPTPIYAFLLAFLFCAVNGVMQARGAVKLSRYPANDMEMYRVYAGAALFAIGFLINIHSDHVLRNLRKPGEVGYKIPKGGLFEYVSCANFLGEIIEWGGFALASWSSVSLAFAVFTFSNLVPRAIFHHRWYLEKFEDYPRSRTAVIPFLI